MRRNRVQAEIAENYGVSQPAISRAISAISPLLVQALLDYVPTAHELDAGTCYIVDGTLLPCWSWRAHPELYSGKHKTTGPPRGLSDVATGYPRRDAAPRQMSPCPYGALTPVCKYSRPPHMFEADCAGMTGLVRQPRPPSRHPGGSAWADAADAHVIS
jgi:hypothetical protein